MAFITNTDTTVTPYNDDDMKYDIDLHQYVLTASGVYKYTGININEEFDIPKEAEFFLIECSDDVYNFIYNYTRMNYVDYKRYLIATSEDLRDEFKRALVYQVRYAFRSGAHLIKDQHGINLERNKVTSINDLRNDIGIAKNTRDILSRQGLLYTGFIPNVTPENDGTW